MDRPALSLAGVYLIDFIVLATGMYWLASTGVIAVGALFVYQHLLRVRAICRV